MIKFHRAQVDDIRLALKCLHLPKLQMQAVCVFIAIKNVLNYIINIVLYNISSYSRILIGSLL